MIGQTISHYHILEKLGEGGMGVVYKAQDTKLDRLVALKFLPQHVSPSDLDKARFVQEAKAAASLNHPNICTIYGIEEVGAPEGASQTFIVMEFVEGQTLRVTAPVGADQPARPIGADVAGGRSALLLKQAIEIGIQIADGLAAAHEKGIVHRDIKPENIMLQKDGRVRIMDFGLAKLKGASRLTKAGSTVGTISYMSPEQVQGMETDHRTDIFSLGVILYEMFAGQSPFKGMHETAIMYEIMNVDPQPISTIKPEINADLDAIVLECLAKEQDQRYQSAKELVKNLKRFKQASSAQRFSRISTAQHFSPGPSTDRVAEPSKPTWRNYLWPVLTVIALIIGAVATWLLVQQRTAPPSRVTRFVVTLPEGQALHSIQGGPLVALSPDGTKMAFVGGSGANAQLFIRDMDTFEARPVPNTSDLFNASLFFSPDSRWLGLYSKGKIMKLSLDGGSPIAICNSLGGDASWGSGGTIVFRQDWGSPLWIVATDAGSTPKQLTKIKFDEGERAHISPHVLPGGTQALFTIWTGGSFEESLIAVVDLKTGEHRVILKGGSDARYVSPGYIIYARGSTVMAAGFDLNDLKVTGEPDPVTDNVRFAGALGHSLFSVSENGTLVLIKGGVEITPTEVFLSEGAGKTRTLSVKGVQFGDPLFSPDGKRLVVTIYGSTYQVGVFDIQRDVLTPLTFGADNWRHAWHADGSGISFSSNADGRYQIYTVSANGGGTPRKLFDQDGNPFPESWSPDGKYLAYTVTNKETGTDIWLYSANGEPKSKPLINTRAGEISARFSPDGRWIAYVSDESGQNEVYVQPFPALSGKYRISSSGGGSPRWSSDSRRIYYAKQDDIFSLALNVEGKSGALSLGKPEMVTTVAGLLSYDLAPNGKTLAIARRGVAGTVNQVHVVLNWFEELKTKVRAQK